MFSIINCPAGPPERLGSAGFPLCRSPTKLEAPVGPWETSGPPGSSGSQLTEAAPMHPQKRNKTGRRNSAHIPGWILCEVEALSLGLGSLQKETSLNKSQPDTGQQCLCLAFPRCGCLPILGSPCFCPAFMKDPCSQSHQALQLGFLGGKPQTLPLTWLCFSGGSMDGPSAVMCTLQNTHTSRRHFLRGRVDGFIRFSELGAETLFQQPARFQAGGGDPETFPN